jgi:ubiquitin carboxyl-terminal hydrolase 8
LFSNRDKFDLVAIYDDSSESFDKPLSVLVRAIYEIAFQKMLKRMPVLIVGGLDAWKRDLGQDEIVRGGLSLVLPELPKVLPLQSSATGPSSTVLSQPFPEPHKLWTPQTKADRPVPSLDKNRLLQNEDRGRPSLDLSSQCVRISFDC